MKEVKELSGEIFVETMLEEDFWGRLVKKLKADGTFSHIATLGPQSLEATEFIQLRQTLEDLGIPMFDCETPMDLARVCRAVSKRVFSVH